MLDISSSQFMMTFGHKETEEENCNELHRQIAKKIEVKNSADENKKITNNFTGHERHSWIFMPGYICYIRKRFSFRKSNFIPEVTSPV